MNLIRTVVLPTPDFSSRIFIASGKVSATEEPHVTYQIAPALKFLSENQKEFEHLKRLGVDNMLLDFGMSEQQVIERAQYLPPELITAMSRYDMGLVFSTVRIPTG